MSYNIDSTDVITLDAWMLAGDVRMLLAGRREELPECSFLEEMESLLPPEAVANPALDIALAELAKHDSTMATKLAGAAEEKRIPLPNFWWYGEGSGRALAFLMETVAPLIRGKVEVVFTWEGGDSHTGLVIRDGVATEMDVALTLVAKKKKR